MFLVYLFSLLFLGELALVFSSWLLGGVGGDVVMLLSRVVDDVLFAEMVWFVAFVFSSFTSAGRKKNRMNGLCFIH